MASIYLVKQKLNMKIATDTINTSNKPLNSDN